MFKTIEEARASYVNHIKPKYPNGTGKHVPVIIRFIPVVVGNGGFGIRFEVNPVVGQIVQERFERLEIMEVL